MWQERRPKWNPSKVDIERSGTIKAHLEDEKEGSWGN